MELVSDAQALVKGVRKASDLATKIRGAADKLEGLKGAIRNGDRGPKTALTNEISKDTGYQFGDLSGRLQTGGSVGAALKRLNQIDRDVLDDLTGAERTRLLEYFAKYPRSAQLVDDAGADGFRLLEDLDDASLQTVLNLQIDRADELRLAFARTNGEGYANVNQIDEFANKVDNLDGIVGLNSGPVDDVINAGASSDIRGALREVKVADDIGANDIRQMNLELGSSSQFDGELDIQRQSGKIVEVKSSFGYDETGVSDQFRKKLRTMREHEDVDLDGNTLEVRADTVIDEDAVETQITNWEQRVAQDSQWGRSDVTIRVREDSSGTVIQR